MTYRCGTHAKIERLPPSIEAYVVGDYPVRVYDAFVEASPFKNWESTSIPARRAMPHTIPYQYSDCPPVYGYSFMV